MRPRPHRNRFRRSLLATGAVLTLTLAACGDDSTSSSTNPTAETNPTSEAAPEPLIDAEVGEEITEDGAAWTIHSISRNAECDYGTTGEVHDGADLIQLRAEVKNDDAGEGFVFDPTGEDVDWPGDIQNGDKCETVPGDDGYLAWEDTIEPAPENFVYGAFAVPEGSEFMNIRGYRFALPEDYIDDVEVQSGDNATPEVTEPEPELETEPQSIWAPAGEGYQCPRTDAFVWDPANCTPENLGAEPIPDPATIPIPDGGTCPAYLCGYGHDENGNPNPSSGELQTQGGCEDGYITDPELCAAVGRPLQ